MMKLSITPNPTKGNAATVKSRVAWSRVKGVAEALELSADVHAASPAAASLPAAPSAVASVFRITPINDRCQKKKKKKRRRSAPRLIIHLDIFFDVLILFF
jgi:hypothetical protein